jgi:hypothetical protein
MALYETPIISDMAYGNSTNTEDILGVDVCIQSNT